MICLKKKKKIITNTRILMSNYKKSVKDRDKKAFSTRSFSLLLLIIITNSKDLLLIETNIITKN